jgi:hypothetical protein
MNELWYFDTLFISPRRYALLRSLFKVVQIPSLWVITQSLFSSAQLPLCVGGDLLWSCLHQLNSFSKTDFCLRCGKLAWRISVWYEFIYLLFKNDSPSAIAAFLIVLYKTIKYICYLLAGRSALKNIFPRSQKRPEPQGRGTLQRPRENIFQVRTDLNGK